MALALALPLPCTIPGCEGKAARCGLCWGHVARRQRGLTVSTQLARKRRDLWGNLAEAAFRYAECGSESDAEFDAAKDRLRVAAVRYVASLPSVAGVTLGIVRECQTEQPTPAARATQLALF